MRAVAHRQSLRVIHRMISLKALLCGASQINTLFCRAESLLLVFLKPWSPQASPFRSSPSWFRLLSSCPYARATLSSKSRYSTTLSFASLSQSCLLIVRKAGLFLHSRSAGFWLKFVRLQSVSQSQTQPQILAMRLDKPQPWQDSPAS